MLYPVQEIWAYYCKTSHQNGTKDINTGTNNVCLHASHAIKSKVINLVEVVKKSNVINHKNCHKLS